MLSCILSVGNKRSWVSGPTKEGQRVRKRVMFARYMIAHGRRRQLVRSCQIDEVALHEHYYSSRRFTDRFVFLVQPCTQFDHLFVQFVISRLVWKLTRSKRIHQTWRAGSFVIISYRYTARGRSVHQTTAHGICEEIMIDQLMHRCFLHFIVLQMSLIQNHMQMIAALQSLFKVVLKEAPEK